MKYLKTDVNINALGCGSGFGFSEPIASMEDGSRYCVTAKFPDLYAEYIKPIFAKLNDDHTAVEIISDYGNGEIPLDGSGRWESPTIGLSYASCDITITVKERDGESK